MAGCRWTTGRNHPPRSSPSAAPRFCSGCPRSTETGDFDPDFFLYYEDTDLSWRLRAAGWTVRYEATAVVRHAHAASSDTRSRLFRFYDDRNRLLMLIKNAPAGLASGRSCATP